MKTILYWLAAFVLFAGACKKTDSGNSLPLVVKGFWPNSGNPGTIVHIQGQGFGKRAEDNQVQFGSQAAKVTAVSDSEVTVLAPTSGQTGLLTLQVSGKKLDLGNYTYQQLTLTTISPLNGPAGTNISIHGAGFSSLKQPPQVTINGKAAIVTGASDTLLVAAVPDGAGSGKIVVTVDGQTVTGPDFTYQRIAAVKPLKGGAGTVVTISGEGFNPSAAGNSVYFNGQAATIVSANASSIVVKAPAGVTTGPVSLVISGQKTLGSNFTVIPPPLFKTVTPLSGPAGTSVVISGNNFSNFADEITLTFNGMAATITQATEQQVTVSVPAGCGAGLISMTVNGQTTQGPQFKEQALSVAQLVPDNGLDGTVVTINGQGFGANPTDNIVTFNGVAAVVTSASATSLTVKAPTGFTTGTVNVTSGGLQATGPLFRRAGVITIVGGPNDNTLTYPQGVAVDRSGNVFVSTANRIVRVTPGGVISTFAGDASSYGAVDGPGATARFFSPTTLVADQQDNIYVADGNNNRIRKITPDGTVSTFSKLGFIPTGLGIDGSGTLYVGAQYSSVYRLDALGNATQLFRGVVSPTSNIAIDNTGKIFYTGDYSYNAIYTPLNGLQSIYSGNYYGAQNGPVATALYATPTGITFDPTTGNLYLCDNNAVRMIANGIVSTVTGWKGGTNTMFGFRDGTLDQASFYDTRGLCVDKDGNIYVVEGQNKAVRKIILK